MGYYQVVALLGKGGMRTVYRANDSRLGPEVAIKISQERFSRRFGREARAGAPLKHSKVFGISDNPEPVFLLLAFCFLEVAGGKGVSPCFGSAD